MALTKKEKNQLQSVLNDLERVKKYLLKEHVIIGQLMNLTALPGDTFINKKTGEQMITFNKHVGTELYYLYNGINNLKCLIKPKKSQI